MRVPRPTALLTNAGTVGSQLTSNVGLETTEPRTALIVEPRWHQALSVAMMAGIAFLPIVIAVGFLAEHLESSSVPVEISADALRGPIDADHHDDVKMVIVEHGAERPSVRVRAGS